MRPLTRLTPDWPALSAMLDEALALPSAERGAWLEALHTRPGLSDAMRSTLLELLASGPGVETNDFMSTLPPLGVAAVASDEPKAGMEVGPYRLISELGRGGMGAVWLAERSDGQLKRQVALKLPHLTWAGNLAERMARERDILATLDHPHIARLYDASVDSMGRPWLALEYVQGRSIDAYARERALDVPARLALLLQVCSAVAYAHSRLVIHRDLKPSNILVTDDGQVRLLDFGIAKLVQGERAEATALTQMAGRALTPDYASPEQVRGEPLGTASDVYSLGVVAYELLAGQRPYRLKRGTAAELEEAISSVDPPLASAVATEPSRRRQLAGDLDAILNKALKKSSRDRYPTVDAFAQDLQRHVGRQPVLARPDTLTYRLRKFASRYRMQVTVGAAATCALLAGAGLALWQARVAQTQAQRAEQVKALALSLFGDANPFAGAVGRRSLTAVELLQQAQKRLAAQPIEDPAVRVELLTAVGSSLQGLGEYAQAADSLEQATALAEAQLDPDHRVRAAAGLALGEALVQAGRTDRALLVLEGARSDMLRLGNLSGVVHAMTMTAGVHLTAGRFADALALSDEALRLAEKHLVSSDRGELINAYATRWEAMSLAHVPGLLDVARRGYELAHELEAGRATSLLISMRFRYAYSLSEEGDAVQGHAEMKEVLAQRIAVIGPDHHEVYLTQLTLGHGAMTLGEPRAAAEHYREALRIALRASGDRATHNAAVARMSLGRALVGVRRPAEALPEFERARDDYRSVDPKHAYATPAQLALAGALTQVGRLDDAEAALAELGTISDGMTSLRAQHQRALGTLRSTQKRHAQALPLLRQSADYFAHQPRQIPRAAGWAALGLAELEAGHPGPAIEALQRARAIFEKVQPRTSPDLADLLVAQARAHLALSQTAAALACTERAVAFWREFDSGNRSFGLALMHHAQVLSAMGRAADAGAALREATDALKSTGLPQDHALLQGVRKTTP